jgi:hypothetical protein
MESSAPPGGVPRGGERAVRGGPAKDPLLGGVCPRLLRRSTAGQVPKLKGQLLCGYDVLDG